MVYMFEISTASATGVRRLFEEGDGAALNRVNVVIKLCLLSVFSFVCQAGLLVRSLLSDHKVPSSVLALLGFNILFGFFPLGKLTFHSFGVGKKVPSSAWG